MQRLFLLLFLSILPVVITFSKALKGSRSKRVINGYVPIINKERPFEYDVIRYSAWIGAATSCTSPKTVHFDLPKWWTVAKRPCLPDIDDQRCGGALIHPRIVQTAGHCVGSEVLTVDNPNTAWAPGRVWSVWEDMQQIFVGQTDVEEFLNPSYSRYYLLHPKYARLRNTNFSWVSHDYGWIILNEEPTRAKYWSNLVAPVPTIEALATHTRLLLAHQDICLFAGFGAWQYTDKEILNTTSSRYLRYGWQMTTSYTQCWWYLHVLTTTHALTWKYARYATWFCHVGFGSHVWDHPGVGDSGSPVHCNGRMLALVSGGKWQRVNFLGKTRMHITRTMGLAFSTFENTANFREYFVSTLKWYARVRQVERKLELITRDPLIDEFDPTSTKAMIYSAKSEVGLGVLPVSHVILALPIILKILKSVKMP